MGRVAQGDGLSHVRYDDAIASIHLALLSGREVCVRCVAHSRYCHALQITY